MRRCTTIALFCAIFSACPKQSYVECTPDEYNVCPTHGVEQPSHVAGVVVVDSIEECSPRTCGRYDAEPSTTMFRITAHWEQQCLGAPQDQVIVYSNYPATRQKIIVGDRHVAGNMLKMLNATLCTGHDVDGVAYSAGYLDVVQSWAALHRLDESDRFELSYRADQTATVDLADFLTECAAVAELQDRDPDDSRPPLVLPEWGCAPDAGSLDGG